MMPRDWKHLAKVKDIAVQRKYDRLMVEVEQAVMSEGNSRDRVHKTKEVIAKGIREVREIFDDLRYSRSNADLYLRGLVANELLTEDELAGFSDELRADVARWRARWAELDD